MLPNKNSPVRFVLIFISLFLIFYYFNIAFFGITSPGKYYSPFLVNHLNYIQALRWLLLNSSAAILKLLGFATIVNDYELLVAGHGSIRMVYSCLGLGVISFFTAFVIAYPKPVKAKIGFLIVGILGIQLLNILRFIVLALYWRRSTAQLFDHHTIFNITIYIIISITLYFWVTANNGTKNNYAKN